LSFAILPAVVYVLCVATSATCAVLLARTYARTRSRLLLWTALSFGLLAVNNLFLVLDMLVLRQIDFQPVRGITFIGALLVLLYGFIWEVD
jgi:hypothetical protein